MVVRNDGRESSKRSPSPGDLPSINEKNEATFGDIAEKRSMAKFGYIVYTSGEHPSNNLGVYAVKMRIFCRDSAAI